MALNKLQQDFKDAIEELILLVGRNGTAFSLMINAAEGNRLNLKGEKKAVGQSGLPFYDITVKNKPDTYMTCEQYKVDTDNLEDELYIIMNHTRLLYIAQAYEVLESFLYNHITQMIIEDADVRTSVKLGPTMNTFEEVREALRTLPGERKLNKHLIKIIRTNCTLFASCESSNYYNFDFKEWFKMLGCVRNCITHNRGEVTTRIEKELNKLPCSNNRFTIEKQGHKDMLHINFGHCSQLLLDIGNYMFFVHKAINKKCYNIDTSILSMKDLFPSIRFCSTHRQQNCNSGMIS